MNVGDYVRTRYGFDRLVDKRKDDNYDYYWYRFGNGKTMTNPENGFVIKSSPNIIDLIEVGDYVNGHRVTNFMLDNGKKIGVFVEATAWGYDADEIKSIVTREQFSQMEYKVGE